MDRGELKARIDAEIGARIAEWFGDLPPAHLDALRGILADGKRLRGGLACQVAEALGAQLERALPAAVVIEVVQAASLVHDDFVDADTLRRGRAAAWTWLTPRRAVLAADAMFATALERMALLGAAEAATLAQAIAAMARGALVELLDAQSAYPRIIEWKTGSLFAAAARLGALAAGAGAAELEAAREFGARTGQAYQVADDLADVVQLCSGARFSWQRIRGLAPALLYFGTKPGVPLPEAAMQDEQVFRAWLAGAAPGIQRAMRVEIEVLIEQAKAALTRFPDNERTRSLHHAPQECVRTMATA